MTTSMPARLAAFIARTLPGLVLACCAPSTLAGNDGGSDTIGLLELFNYYEYSPLLASSGQPAREQIPALAAAGIEAVVSLVPAGEPLTYPDEARLVVEHGMDFVHIPVDWADPPLADVETFLAAMRRFAGRRVLVHCYANARASAFVYLWRVRAAGDDEAEARAALVEIWDWNEGYALDEVPHWQAFIERARQAP